MKTLRVILSLPGDVGLEKEAAARVLDRVKTRVAPVAELHTLLWEHDIPAFASPPAAGAEPPFLPAQADIVICLMWSRMGARPGFAPSRPDGQPYASGTEYIFEEALRVIRPPNTEGGAHAGPHLAVYIKDAPPILPLKPRAERERLAGHADYVDQVLAHWTSVPQRPEGPYFLRFRHLDELLGDVEERLWNAIIAREHGAEAIRNSPSLPWRFPEQHGSPYRGLLPFEAEQ
ncbi:MAG TPA: hypothetical protein VK970_07420, partial [Candidatus Methylacidiphilales bacterium]|nr:hypothetical protein [Candidatus Methylacidiphilales bacterium]